MFRTEHPKPQWRRESFENLNGPWDFTFDFGGAGEKLGLQNADAVYDKTIEVPFCPESSLSGIGYTNFIDSCWYRRTITVTEAELSGIVRLHFGAVDYKATLFVNGKRIGTHTGGYVSFYFDIQDALTVGENRIVLHAEDDTRSPLIPSGKQSTRYESHGCFYTRTTGIWQTVWLERLPKVHIESAKYYPDIENGTLTVTAELAGAGTLTARALWEGKPMGEISLASHGGHTTFTLPLAETHLWEVGVGGLYDLTLTYGDDRVESYFGLRSARLDGYKFLINERSVFQRLVLDQGFYPDGIYTAPSDEALCHDIEMSMAVGFNGARLHEKIFEERFLYHADRLGYLVWGEYPNWGADPDRHEFLYAVLPEWMAEMDRDFNHPSIIGWCPLNESFQPGGRTGQIDEILKTIYRVTKAKDPTRPCIDTSGYIHTGKTDIFDVHDYEQNPEAFARSFEKFESEDTFQNFCNRWQKYPGKMPMFVSEYGGTQTPTDSEGWGYGNAPKTYEEFYARIEGLTDVLLQNGKMFGYCYTQLTDVEQEQNGIYYYDRSPKYDTEKLRSIFGKKAKIED